MNIFLNVLTLIIIMSLSSTSSLILRKRDSPTDELFKHLLKSTRLTVQIPSERREHCIKPGATKESSVNGQQIAEKSVKPAETNSSIRTQNCTNHFVKPVATKESTVKEQQIDEASVKPTATSQPIQTQNSTHHYDQPEEMKEPAIRGQQIDETSVKPTVTNQSIQTQNSTPHDHEVSSFQGSQAPNKLNEIYQALYVAQAQVQLEVKQIQRAQSLAAAQQKSLEDASMSVRTITGALHAAQQDVATAAMRAQTAQLQLAAHDQLLFAARQKVDALSSEAVRLQAEESIVLSNLTVDIQSLLGKLSDPLPENLKPTAIPAMCPEMESKLASALLSTTAFNQSAPVKSNDQNKSALEKAIREIIESQINNSVSKRSIGNFKIHKDDLRRSAVQYDDYFYRWFINDIQKESRKRRRLKEVRARRKQIYDNYD